jgi:two-component system, OmpR family, sensor histidine kinase KdpD
MVDEDHKRPKPEKFMEMIKAGEENNGKGKLTIYFGAAPGVGKTYTMLYDARLQKSEGKDIVVGYIEPHKRPETEALLESHEIIPPCIVKYKNVELKEMDIDAILARKPQIVLMDELAHTNAPGLRNLKRYQDAEEILNVGIDVWTTLNVQHLESLNDSIFKIAKIHVRETLPDTIFNTAHEVKLIDLSPERLLKRLEEGKIYVKDMAEQAIKNFFKIENLLALREITLRLVANKIDEQMQHYMGIHPLQGPWPTKERILVGVYPSPDAEQLVRSAFKLISHSDGELIAIHIETSDNAQLSEKEHQWLTNAIEKAKKLGATIAWIKGEDVADEISNYAHSHNITKIVIGKSHKQLFRSLSQKIITSAKDIDLFLIAGHSKEEYKPHKKIISRPFDYVVSAIAVTLVSLLGYLVQDVLGETNLLFLLLLPVILIAVYLGRGPSIFAACISIIFFDYLFVLPHFTFVISDFKYFFSFAAYLGIVVLISNLTFRLRNRIKQVKESEAKSTMLYELSRGMVAAKGIDETMSILTKHIQEFFPCEVAAFLPVTTCDEQPSACEVAAFLNMDHKLSVKAQTSGFKVDSKELAVANWVMINGRPAGPSTGTLPEAWAYYLPLKTSEKIIGVIGFHFENSHEALTTENKIMLETMIQLSALAIERLI